MSSQLMSKQGNKTTSRVGPTVSRRLRAMDWNVRPAARKAKDRGIFVSVAADLVTVMFDMNLSDLNKGFANTMADELMQQPWADDIEVTWPTEHGACGFIHFRYVKA